MDVQEFMVALGSKTRRRLIQAGAMAAVSQAIALPAAVEAADREQFPEDLTILNVALGLEHQAIAAYQAAAESKLLSGSTLEMALCFQADHKRHRDVIVRLIERYHGSAVEAKPTYDFGSIKAAGDILELAHRLEQGAADAYLANAAKLQNTVILNEAAGILADEVRHATVFKQALGLSVTERSRS
ncbi:MAG: DUF4439 domain-containing protein [Acidobacteria bacterium]|nr:DUF4439 domain-containing protein [Acidobacteriota bacterium]